MDAGGPKEHSEPNISKFGRLGAEKIEFKVQKSVSNVLKRSKVRIQFAFTAKLQALGQFRDLIRVAVGSRKPPGPSNAQKTQL